MQILTKKLSGTSSLQLFQVMQFSTTILVGILLAKSGLPTEMISIYEAWMFIVSLFCFFWVVGGQNTLLQLFPKLDEEGKKAALFNVFLLFTLAGAASGAVLFLTQDLIVSWLTSFSELPWLNLLSLFLVLNSPTLLIQIFYLLLKKYKHIVVFGLLSFGLQLTAIAIPVYLNGSLKEVMYGLLCWAAFKYVWAVVLLVQYAHWRGNWRFLKAYLPLTLPLLLLAFIGKGSEYVSGLVVTLLSEDDKAFAVYRYGAREFPLAVLLVGTLSTSLLPEVSENLEAGLAQIRRTTQQLSHWLYPLSMASMLVAPFLFPIIFNPDFKESARIFNIFTLLLTSRILLPQVVTMSARRNYVLAFSAFVELLVLVVLSWWWGTLFGLEGVAFATVAAFVVDRLILLWYNWRMLGILPGKYVDWRSYLIYNGLLAGAFLLSLQF